MDKIARDVVLAVISIFVFCGVSFAATSKDCQPLILQTQSWVTAGKPAAVQVTFNETKGDKGRFGLADGHLKSYKPADVPELENLVKRGQPGAFQQLSKTVMGGLKFDDANSAHTSEQEFSVNQIANFVLMVLRDGEVLIIQDKTVSPVKNLQCFTASFYDPGYYMTGFIEEGDSTALVSFAVRNVMPQSK